MSRHAKAFIVQGIAPRSQFYQGPFGRLFRNLPPFEPPGKTEPEKVQFFQDLADQMVEPQGSNLDNDKIPSGYTYFGQFIDHDITFDPTSSLQRQNDPDRLRNFRTPRYDLDSLYGEGPADEPFMYDQTPGNGGKLLVGKVTGANEDDLPRNNQDRALIGDPRNDENIFVSQLQLGFIKFHNKMIDKVQAEQGLTGNELFQEAQRLVRWHYQWVVVHDFLVRLVGKDLVKTFLPDKDCPHAARLCYYGYKHQPFMPVEFSVAAYRLGHSMVRGGYKLNKVVGPLPIFNAADPANSLTHFGGFRPLPQFWTIQWNLFLEIAGSNSQKSRLIDTKLVGPLAKLPGNVDSQNRSLAFLNLLRGWRLSLPSGQTVAKAMGLPKAEILEQENNHDDPLWHYILREAEIKQGGKQLGIVGGTIVGEVFIGLLAGDPLSYLNMEPAWEPELPKEGGNFELRDILRFAGVPLTENDLPF